MMPEESPERFFYSIIRKDARNPTHFLPTIWFSTARARRSDLQRFVPVRLRQADEHFMLEQDGGTFEGYERIPECVTRRHVDRPYGGLRNRMEKLPE